MSRIGKNPVPVPAGVEVQISGNEVSVKGKLGQLKTQIVPEMDVAKTEMGIAVKLRDLTKRSRQLWGLSRSLVRNMVQGVTQGYNERLEIQGVGYKAAVQGGKISDNPLITRASFIYGQCLVHEWSYLPTVPTAPTTTGASAANFFLYAREAQSARSRLNIQYVVLYLVWSRL